MVDVFSFNDILIAVFFIVPGFIAVGLFKRLALVEKELTELEIVAWSIFLSLIVYAIFLAFSGTASIATLQEQVFSWQQVAIVIGLAVAIGAIPGIIVKFSWRRGLRPGALWDFIMNRVKKKTYYPTVRIHTDKETYEGVLFLWGRDKSPKDIIIVRPEKV